ncbi:hypothetical protein PMAN_a1134 [Pseudoalteromonas marina]|nr:hypothetical protein PMAN_a1134 [Pseudoalteromonas marina]GAA74352.1 hypothetical protein P20480_0812 [Pseudoalteromonas sp. BSi20480]
MLLCVLTDCNKNNQKLPALFDKAQFITFNAKKWGQIDSS